jgi:hypothetical protein
MEVYQESTFIATFTEASSMRNTGADVYLYSFEYAKRNYHSGDLTFIMGIHPFEYDADDEVFQF